MTKEEGLRFKENWAVVNQVIIEEQRRKTVEQRLDELDMLHKFGSTLGWDRYPNNEDELVRARWQSLREKLGA